MIQPELFGENEDDEIHARRTWEGIAAPIEPGFEMIAPWLVGRHRDHRSPAGDRARRPALDAMAAPPTARGNWLPIGPRDVAGRVRALAATPMPPGTATVLYAGTASGGVYRTTDRGLNWTRLWTAEPSLSIGAIGVAAGVDADHDRVYVATGEVSGVAGHGIWVSSASGAPGSWTVGNPAPPDPIYDGGFEAVAIHPTDRDHVWAVGPGGAYRSLNGGQDWTLVDPGVSWWDAHFASDGRLFLARGGPFDDGGTIVGRAMIVRLAAANVAAATAADLVAPGNVSTILQVAAGEGPWPGAVKFAIARSDETRIFARAVDEQENHLGIFRTTRADRATTDFQWARLADSDDFFGQGQGLYDLCIVVHPTDPNLVATGMVDIHVSKNAGAAAASVVFDQAMSWRLHEGDRAHHADQHHLVALDDELWVADDGGVSMCPNWRVGTRVGGRHPVTHTSFVWESRDDGISASQLYDINPSPLLPGVVAAGFQDNGTHMSASGQTWRNIYGGDGGFASFDPDDPYSMLVTTQNGIGHLDFAGHHDVEFPDEQPPGPVGSTRGLGAGFRFFDPPLFVADTARHPTDRARVLHARLGRLYGLRGATGEQWEVEPLGASFEIRVVRDAVAQPRLRATILDTPGAHRLGLVAGSSDSRHFDDPAVHAPPPPNLVAFGSHLRAPFTLQAGDEVRLRVDGDPADHVVRFTAANVVDLAQVTTTEVIAAFAAAAVPGLEALPRLWGISHAVEVVTAAAGATRSIQLSGSAVDTADVGTTRLHGLSRLGLNAGTYRGGDGMPASITLGMLPYERDEQLAGRRFPAANRTLSIAVNGGATRTITLGPPRVPDPDWVSADELAAAIRHGLRNDDVHVVACTRRKFVVLKADPGHTVAVGGTAADALGLRAFPRDSMAVLGDFHLDRHLGRNRRNFQTFDLTPVVPGTPLDLEITDGATPPVVVRFDGAAVGNLRCVTAEELYLAVRTALATAVPTRSVEVELVSYVDRGEASELAWSNVQPDRVWAGRSDGLVSRSDDNGATWTTLGVDVLDRAEAQVEAIALHPTDADIAFVGHWSVLNMPAHHAMVHRTDDGGASWTPCGIEHDGHEVAVRALELHPTEADVVFAGTDHGVYWSQDSGANWTPFNEGLTHCSVIDLAVEHDGPHLVAATWGAGAFRRYIGSAAPDDVRLNVRTDELDRGSSTTVALNPFSTVAGFARSSSPDIHVTRPGLTTVAHDGVRFDLDVPTEAPVAGQDFDVLVQVHNRGSLPARSGPLAADPKVRVVILGADVVDGPPDLPADFWMRFTAGALVNPAGGWTVLADTALPRDLVAETPQVLRQNVPTATMPLAERSLGVLVLVSGAADTLTSGELSIGKLVAGERRAAYRQIEVLRADEDTRLVLRGMNRQTIELVDVAPATSPAAGALRLAAGSGTSVVAAPSPPATTTYDLSAADPWITLREHFAPVSITFDNAQSEFARLDRARPAEVAAYIARRLRTAGVPMSAFTNEDHHRLRALGDATVEVTGGSGTGGTLLGFAPAGAQPAVTSPVPTGAMPFGATLDIRLRAHALNLPVSLSVETDRDWEMADLLNRQLRQRGLDGMVVAESPVGLFLWGAGSNEHTVSFVLGEAVAGDLARLGLTAGTFAGGVGVALAPVDLTTNPTITITVTHDVRVRFRRDPGALGTANAISPAEVRRAINEMMEFVGMAIRAEPAATRLIVGESSSDRGPSSALTGGADLAEIATSGTAAAATPADLFDIRLARRADRLKAGQPNHVYVRGRNDGNVATRAGRWRLYRIEFGAPVVTHHLDSGSPHSDNIDADTRVIADITYTPTAAANETEVVLAIVDDADGIQLDPPGPTWLDVRDFLTWVDRHDNASIRRFEVSA